MATSIALKNTILLVCALSSATALAQEPLYHMSADKPRWATFKNPKATVGAGGMENQTAKGHAFEPIKDGHSLKPISVAYDKGFMKLLEGTPPALDSPNFPDGWVNFYRQEDDCATAYFYLDKPVNGLPALAGVSNRTKGM